MQPPLSTPRGEWLGPGWFVLSFVEQGPDRLIRLLWTDAVVRMGYCAAGGESHTASVAPAEIVLGIFDGVGEEREMLECIGPGLRFVHNCCRDTCGHT